MPVCERKASPVLSWDELKEIKARDLNGTLLLHKPSGKTKERTRTVPVPYLNQWKPVKLIEGCIRDRLTTTECSHWWMK